MEVVADRFLYKDKDKDWSVLAGHDVDESASVRLVGEELQGIHIGETVKAEGRWIEDARHGWQFRVSRARISNPSSMVGIANYLEQVTKGKGVGVGPAMAQKIARHFGEDTLEILDTQPERLAEVKGLSKTKAELVIQVYDEAKPMRRVRKYLAERDLSPTVADKIYQRYGENTIHRLQENPYCVTELERVGFRVADDLGSSMGIALNDPRRIDAGLTHVVREAENQGLAVGTDSRGREKRIPGGNCFLPVSTLIGAIRHALKLDDSEELGNLIADRILHQAKMGKLVMENLTGEEPRVYSPRMYQAEGRLAEKIRSLASAAPGLSISDEDLNRLMDLSDFSPTDEQRQAIHRSFKHRISILTGGPGTGKTATVRMLCQVLSGAGMSVSLAAPTGKAAKRITEATSHPAKTIHRLLEWQPGEGFTRNRRYPLDCDVLVVDESSMLDLVLADQLFEAVNPRRTHVVLIGDVDQLPAVDAGRVLADMITSRIVPLTHLTKIFRQAARSMIIQAAYSINRGEIPNTDPKVAADRASLKDPDDVLRDFFFVSREENEVIADLTVAFATERIPRKYGFNPIEDIQVIAPQRSSDIGVTALNRRLQSILNPSGEPIGKANMRVGDKLLCRHNDYTNNIMNGEFVRITDFHHGEELVELQIDERRVRMGIDDVAYNFTLAYAVTCHSMQGSSAKAIIVPLSFSFFTMLSRPLLYTAVTRAEQVCVLVGQQRAVATAVSNDKDSQRHTALAARLVDPSLSGQLV